MQTFNIINYKLYFEIPVKVRHDFNYRPWIDGNHKLVPMFESLIL